MWEAAAGWAGLGVALHLANQVARGRGWCAIVSAASSDESGPRRRDAIAAWVAGAGAGGLVSARGGDAVRVLLLKRHVPEAGCPMLAGTLVAEGAGELATGALLLALAAALGVGPALGFPGSTALWALAAAAVAAAVAITARRVRLTRRHGSSSDASSYVQEVSRIEARARGSATPIGAPSPVGRLRRIRARLGAASRGVGRGCAPLGAPGAYARAVLPWQLASRACRLGALACFLAAFGLPVTPAAVLLVAFAQGGGRLVPFAPASAGASAALLAATFGPVTGSAVSGERLAAFFLGTSTLLTVIGAALAIAICLRDQAFAKQGRSTVGVAARAVLARAATVPTP